MKTINQYVQEAHENAVNKGWWEEERSLPELICLMHSELSEALEDYRNGYEPTEMYYEFLGDTCLAQHKETIMEELDWTEESDFKPCGIPSELADVVIRIFDACGQYGIDLEAAINEKMAYNATRPHKHGGKVL